MNPKSLIVLAVALLLHPIAHATPVLYSIAFNFGFFTLDGAPLPPDPGLPYAQFSLGFLTDTSSFTTQHYDAGNGFTQFSIYYSDTIGTATFYNHAGDTLGTITDPLELRFYPYTGRFSFTDLATRYDITNGLIGFFGGVPDISGVADVYATSYGSYFVANTSGGVLAGDYGQANLTTQLNPPTSSSAPEPPGILLLGTGALAAAAALRRRLRFS